MIKPDNISFLSNLPTYINIGEKTGNITIAGSILNGASASFSTSIATSANNNRFDVYGVNLNTNIKQLLSNSCFPKIYQNVYFESPRIYTVYTPSLITVTIDVFNGSGLDIILQDQVIAVTVVEYTIPY
jgi:hypothetical protein